jgi:glycerol-3-phosphate acyltransferase
LVSSRSETPPQFEEQTQTQTYRDREIEEEVRVVLEVMLGEFGAVAVSSLSQAWTARWAAGKYKMPSYPQTYAEALYCTKNSEPLFDVVENCRQDGRETQTVVSDLDGTLLRSRSSFPYFMLIALEAGSPLRALVLLLLSPLVWLVYNFVSESVGIKMLIFFSFAGLRLSAIESAARGVLPKFYLEDMHSISYRLFIACGRRYVVTANPRIMVEPFLKEYLDVEAVMGTEIQATSGGYATGFVASSSSGVLVGMNKRSAVKNFFANETPDIGLGDRESDYPFMSICKEAYVVPSDEPTEAVPKEEYLKPLIFHDGRLACRPTPLMSLVILLWTPIGLTLAVIRIIVGLLVPFQWAPFIGILLGVTVTIKGTPPPKTKTPTNNNNGPGAGSRRGILFVCSHRTLLDPIFLSIAAGRRIPAVTYSISRVCEILSPIRTVRLTRCRDTDAFTMTTLLMEGDLAVCPEGTTCREPYLLRFSSLFAELAEHIVPVTMNIKIQLFHGTTARGWKCLDPIFFFMNPAPSYQVCFLEQLPPEMTCCAGGKSSHEVANYIQKVLADSLGFQCTNFTRKDKYKTLVGHDGSVPLTKHHQRNRSVGC